MATKTKTTYVCDCCKTERSKAGELRRFTITESRLNAGTDVVASVRFDLCAACERDFKKALGPVVHDPEILEPLSGITRDG